MYNETDFNVRLIQSVELHPALYDKSLKEYSNRQVIKEKWAEVCRETIEKWDELSPEEQTIRGKEVQQRWRNLRVCFKRELNKQQRQSGKHRRYIYFGLLSFLLPMVSDRIPSSNITSTVTNETIEECEDEDEEDCVTTEADEPSAKRAKTISNASCDEESLLDTLDLDEIEMEEIDEDKLFLLSLVPTFKRLRSADKKIDLKIEFLQVIKRIKNAHRGGSADEAVSNSKISHFVHITAKGEIEKSVDECNEDYTRQPQRSAKNHSKNIASSDDLLFSPVAERQIDETDEDKLFLLSLVSSFKRLHEDQKIDVKMDFFRVLKRIKNAQ